MRYLIVTGILSVLVGAGAGYLLGTRGSEIPETSSPTSLDGRTHEAIPQAAPVQEPASPASIDGPPDLFDIAAMSSDFDQTAGLYQLLAPLNANEVDRLIDEAAGAFSGSDYRAATAIMIARLAEIDPDLAILRLGSADRHVEQHWTRAIFHSWARQDLDAALASAVLLKPGGRRVAGRAILQAREDLLLSERRDIAERLGTELLIADRGNFAEAWNEALDEPSMQQRFQKLAVVAAQWGMADPMAAMAALESLPPDAMERGISTQIIHGWARQDPQAALAWVLDNDDSPQGPSMIAAVLQLLGQDDLNAALEVARGLEEEQRQNAMHSLIGSWVNADLQAATQWVLNESAGAEREGYLATMVHLLADQEAMLEWLDGLPPEDAVTLLPYSIGAIARADPLEAAAQIDRIDDPLARMSAVESLARSWARRDPQAAQDWLGDQPRDAREAATDDLVNGWAREDPEGALAFTLSLPGGDSRDQMLAGLIGHLSTEQAEVAVSEIQDDRTRRMAETLRQRIRGLNRSSSSVISRYP